MKKEEMELERCHNLLGQLDVPWDLDGGDGKRSNLDERLKFFIWRRVRVEIPEITDHTKVLASGWEQVAAKHGGSCACKPCISYREVTNVPGRAAAGSS